MHVRCVRLWMLGGLTGVMMLVACASRVPPEPRRRIMSRSKASPLFQAVAAGSHHTCGLTRSGVVYCWGDNRNGQLGLGHFEPMDRPRRVLGAVPFVRLVANYQSTCALDRRGRLWCWGMLGSKRRSERSRPRRVPSLFGLRAVAIGSANACVIQQDRSLWCWGPNDWGQLGDGTRAKRTGAVKVKSVGATRAVSLSASHVCAVSMAGSVSCWGRDDSVQVNVMSMTCRDDAYRPEGQAACSVTKPHYVGFKAAPAVDVRVGDAHSCALLKDHSVWCWGSHGIRYAPAPDPPGGPPWAAPGVGSAISLATGSHYTCVVDRKSRLRCWGDISTGQPGTIEVGKHTDWPLKILLEGVQQVVAGRSHACALLRTGQVRCWGYKPTGALGSGGIWATVPRRVPGLKHVVQLVAPKDEGTGLVCARHVNGRVSCWGSGDLGLLGDGSFKHRGAPKRVARLPPVKGLAAADGRACAVARTGRIWCWGKETNMHLQVIATRRPEHSGAGGRPAIDVDDVPTGDDARRLTGIDQVTTLWMGEWDHACARRRDQSVWCWRWSGYYEKAEVLKQEYPTLKWSILRKWNQPRARSWLKGATDLVLGERRIYIKGPGVGTWRAALRSRLSGKETPAPMSSIKAVWALVEGRGFRCEVRKGRRVHCTGRNDFGQLGRVGKLAQSAKSAGNAPLVGPSGVRQLIAGRDHACAVDGAHRLWCWGRNRFGQLGDGTRSHRFEPVRPAGLPAISQVVAGQDFTCALDRKKSVWCWGRNNVGQLGGRFTPIAKKPVPIFDPK